MDIGGIMDNFKYVLFSIAIFTVAACGGGGGDGAAAPTNTNPVANAGVNQTVTENDPVQLAGMGSDAEGAVTFSWTQTSGTMVTLSSTTIANPIFTAPMVAANEMLEFTFAVTDSDGVTITDTVVITVNDLAGNNLPIVDAGSNQSQVEGTTVQLAGSGSDPDGAVTFSWTQTAGTSVTLSDATIVNPTFVAPMVTSTEILEFTLTVTDSAMASVMASVSITITDSVTGGTFTETYQFYTNGLNAVDPAIPASPTEVEPGANLIDGSFGNRSSAEKFDTGTYDVATGVISDIHTYAVIYGHTNGNLYKVSALTSGSLTPVRVSSESMADQMCVGATTRSDTSIGEFANAENSQFVYVLPGADTLCETSDDVWKMVRLGMSATDAPIIARPTVYPFFDLATGAISGWLVHDLAAGELQRCDASFANCTVIASVTNSVNSPLQTLANFILLDIDDQLFVYDINSDTLSSTVFTIPASTFLGFVAGDSNTTYFVHGSLIYQIPVDGSAIATVLVTESSDIQRIEANNTNLVYQLSSGGQGTEIKSVPKAGGTPVSLVTATGTDDLQLMFAKDNLVYYNIRNTTVTGTLINVTSVAAGVIDDDGMNQTETMTAAWIGGTTTNTFNLNNNVSLGALLDKVIIAEGYDIVGTGGGFAGATLRSLDAATSTNIETLGTLPTTDHLRYMFCFGMLDDSLCQIGFTLNPVPAPPAFSFQNEIFYLNASNANSLTRVTNTPNELEQPVQR